MHFVTLLHSTAAAFRSFQQLTSQALGHRLFGTGFRAFTQPAHCQSQTADRTDLNRHLVVRTADTAALHFHERTDVVEGGREHFKSVLAGLFFNVLQSTVDDAFSDGLLAVEHDDVDEFGDFNAAELRIRENLTLGYFATTGHFFLFRCLQSLRPAGNFVCFVRGLVLLNAVHTRKSFRATATYSVQF